MSAESKANEFRIVIADSHEIVREGISAKLQKDCEASVVGQASDGYATLKVCRNEEPDLLLMDLSLTRPSGLDTFRKLRQSSPHLKILILSSDAEPSGAFAMLSEGAVGYMPKQAKSDDFVAAVNAVMMGYSCFPTQYVDDFFKLRRRMVKSGNIYGLSPREIEVLQACVDGYKTREVADRLSISVRTVETHRNSIYRKTDCRDLDALAKMAREL